MTETTKERCSTYDSRAARENIKLVVWVFVWTAAFVISDKAKKFGWWSEEWIAIASIVVTGALGLWMIHCYRRLLSSMDDLQRKIQLDGLSMALGISLVGTVLYSLLVTWGYIVDEEVTDIMLLMCVSYSASVVYGTLKYR
jgi:hypothetical protein